MHQDSLESVWNGFVSYVMALLKMEVMMLMWTEPNKSISINTKIPHVKNTCLKVLRFPDNYTLVEAN